MGENEAGLSVWNGVLAAALRLPNARVDRAAFLRSALAPHVSSEAIESAVQGTPATAGVPATVIRRAAQSSIKWHRGGVTAVSTLSGLPGGWWIAGTIPADLAQFFWHVIVVVQKLAYLHGWPEFVDQEEELDDETKLLLTLFVGVMLGAQGAAEGLGKLATALSSQIAKRLPRAALTKYAVYGVAKNVAKWIGIRLTTKKFAEWVGRAVPIVGGLVAGGITWAAFGAGSKRLLRYLEGLPLAQEGPGRVA